MKRVVRPHGWIHEKAGKDSWRSIENGGDPSGGEDLYNVENLLNLRAKTQLI
jgi:hypothetical protein